MISALMSRTIKVILLSGATIAVAAVIAACGTERISVPSSSPDHRGAVLFSQRCSGCHTLSYAATNGSATNVRTREITNGPNFNVRCERPVTRVLYAIENGGFSGAIMPQNVVVGQDAQAVAKFVADYAGRQTPAAPGVISCVQQPVGTIPPLAVAAAATTTKAAKSAKGKAGKKAASGKKAAPTKKNAAPKKK
jgi:mono/diheme cytochrome c family protein